MLDFETRPPPAVRLLRARKPGHVIHDETHAPAKALRKLEAHTFGNFFNLVIAQNGGVIAALPRTVLDEEAIVSRVVGLDSKRNVGGSLWWSQRLTNARYNSSYKHGDHYVYSTDGLEKNEWFPQHYDVDPDVSETGFDYLTLGGFSVTIRALSRQEARESAVLCHRFSHEFEAAASAVSPRATAVSSALSMPLSRSDSRKFLAPSSGSASAALMRCVAPRPARRLALMPGRPGCPLSRNAGRPRNTPTASIEATDALDPVLRAFLASAGVRLIPPPA